MMSAVEEALCGSSQGCRRRQQCRHLGRRRSLACASSSGGGAGEGAVLLEVRDLCAKVAGSNKQILQGVSLTIRAVLDSGGASEDVRDGWGVLRAVP